MWFLCPGHRCRSRAPKVCLAGREPPQAGSGDPCGLNSKSAWPQGQEPTYHAAGLRCGKRNSQKAKRLCQSSVAGRQLCIKTNSFEISPGGHISSPTQVQLLSCCSLPTAPKAWSEAEMCSPAVFPSSGMASPPRCRPSCCCPGSLLHIKDHLQSRLSSKSLLEEGQRERAQCLGCLPGRLLTRFDPGILYGPCQE